MKNEQWNGTSAKRLLVVAVILVTTGFLLASGDAARPLAPATGGASSWAQGDTGKPVGDLPANRRAVPRLQAAPGTVESIFARGSAIPEPDRPVPLTVGPDPLAQPACTICMEGSAYASWSGSTGTIQLGRVTNYHSSGTSGTLRLQMKATSTYPVWGQTISGYQQSNTYTLGQLQAGYYFSGLDSGSITYYTNIPTGTYYSVMMLTEWDGANWNYDDFVVMNNVIQCTNGVGCTTTSATPTPTPTATPQTGGCTPDATTLCLTNNRFRVRAIYKDYGNNTGSGRAVALTSDSGYFWFFSSTNVELVCKMVSFCNGSSGNFAIYASGLTDVQVTFQVTDTKYGTYREYTNALGHRFTTIGDGPFSCP